MMSYLIELAGEAWENRSDAYWWADRPVLQATVVALAGGMIGFTFKALETAMEARYGR